MTDDDIVRMCATLAALLALTGCATTDKRAPEVASCPRLGPEQWGPPLEAAIQEAFGGALLNRFGGSAHYVRVEPLQETGAGVVVTGRRIGPAAYAMPEPGEGGGVSVTLEPCTARRLSVRRLSELETAPKPLPPSDEAE